MHPNDHIEWSHLDNWLHTVSRSGSYRNFDEIHIDRINPAWKDPHLWIEGGLRSLVHATQQMQKMKIPLHIRLDFSLKPTGKDIRNLKDLYGAFMDSPPRLLMFDTSFSKWNAGKRINGLIDTTSIPHSQVLLLEFSDPSDPRSLIRTLSVLSHPVSKNKNSIGKPRKR